MVLIRIDAHQHFWKLARGDYGWLKPQTGELYRDFLPEDLYPHLVENNIDYTVVVQAAPTMAETEYLLDLYDRCDFIAGVVGWLDFEAANFKERFDRFRLREGFVGVRPMIQDMTDDQWVLRPQVLRNIELLVEKDFPLDLLVLPRHLPYILELLKQFPTLRAVVNHAAKPLIKERVREPWKDQMTEISSFDRVMCKLSGLITEADHHRWTIDQIKPYVQHIVDVFGADSVMFGSDWPVCLQAGSYNDVLRVLQTVLNENLTDEELKKVFGKNAAQCYQLKVK